VSPVPPHPSPLPKGEGAAESAKTFEVRDYDLAATLNSGQAFRWQAGEGGWFGVISRHWVRLRAGESSIRAETAVPVTDWTWLTDYLQLDLQLDGVLRTFPDDQSMQAAVAACRGLRLLRQDPWECLASFILSSTKQIVQIRQIIELLCGRYGVAVTVPAGQAPAQSFPDPARLAEARESELRACKMGFRAPYLQAAARGVAEGRVDLGRLRGMPVENARAELMELRGVGRKVADCVLLFAYGCPSAFPVDVWVMRALRQLYFAGQRVTPQQLRRFAAEHFGPNAGYAQQYLFHYVRTKITSADQT
jgi:N-glycosylase/DNA lyase